jgi:hypothetical protein
MSIFRSVVLKLKEKKGSGALQAVIIFLVCMIFLSVAYEYLRVQILANNIRDSFERAIRTVASENYNEVYAGFKEKIYEGGTYEGGPGDGGDKNEVPEWIPLNDNANVYAELAELLVMNEGDNSLISEKDNYQLSDLSIQVRNADAASSGKYEIKGSMKATMPLHFGGVKVTDAVITIRVTTAYSMKY